MSKLDIITELYTQLKGLDIMDTAELELNAADDEIRDFISLVSNFILQKKQEEVIKEKRF